MSLKSRCDYKPASQPTDLILTMTHLNLLTSSKTSTMFALNFLGCLMVASSTNNYKLDTLIQRPSHGMTKAPLAQIIIMYALHAYVLNNISESALKLGRFIQLYHLQLFVHVPTFHCIKGIKTMKSIKRSILW